MELNKDKSFGHTKLILYRDKYLQTTKNKAMILNPNSDLTCCTNRSTAVWFGKEECSRGTCPKDLDPPVASIKSNLIVTVV